MASPSDWSPVGDLVAGGDVLVLTGAGISTDSGIPDYRGPTGRMRHAAPMTYDRFMGSEAERRRYWARSHIGWATVATAKPNASHHAVAQLEAAGLLNGVVTQNVDGLHSAAGSRAVIDLHGRLDRVLCTQCGVRRPRFEIALRLDAVNPGFRDTVAADPTLARPDGDLALPDHLVDRFRVVACRRCDGVLKPDVVFFGESVPRGRFAAAFSRLDAASVLLVLGSSLMVGSGYRFVTAAADRGLPVAIVNRGATRGDHLATLRLDAALGDVLPAMAATVAGTATRENTDDLPRPAVSPGR